MRITGLDHVQLSMPAGQEDIAREFYARTLGIPEVPKPAELAKRGGAWFESGPVKIHLGVEADFRPARKAHPALIVQDLATSRRNLAQQRLRSRAGRWRGGLVPRARLRSVR
jgi:hypothetical protein